MKKGFTLIEIMIAVGIFGFLSLSMANLFYGQVKKVGYLEDLFEKEKINREVVALLKSTSSCNAALLGVMVHNSTPPKMSL